MYRDSLYLIQYAKDSISRAENAEDGNDCTMRIGTSVMTSSQSIAEIWSMLRLSEPNFKFQLVSFENTPENAREILRNLGENIDIVAGVFDENFLQSRKCSTMQLSREPICVALSIYHPLAKKDSLEISDLYGENLMIIRKGWNTYVDKLRDDLWNHHPRITIKDFSFYDIEIFNRCASSDELLMAIGKWNNIHPLVKVIPVSWNHTIPFGLLHSPKPTVKVQKLLSAINRSPLSEISTR